MKINNFGLRFFCTIADLFEGNLELFNRKKERYLPYCYILLLIQKYKGYRCVLNILLNKERITLNSIYSPFNPIPDL